MSKFTTPVSMQVTREQYEKDLKEPLLELGYKEQSLIWGSTYYNLVNNADEMLGRLSNEGDNFKDYHNRYFIDHYNPTLLLALAAMTDEKDGIAGEYWLRYVCNNDSDFTKNQIYKAIRPINQELAFIDNSGDENGNHPDNRNFFRKATKEELINHFTKFSTNKTDMKKDTIIGYKLTKPEYKSAALAIIDETSFRDYKYGGAVDIQQPYNIEKYRNAGVLSLWFTPVYAQQEQIFKVGNFEVKVKDGKAWHGNDDISTFVKGMKETFGTKSFMAGGFKADVKDVVFSKTGCQNSESKLSEWLEVFKALNK